MAKKKTYKANKLYEIRVSAVVDLDGMKFRPKDTYTVKGKIVIRLGDVVCESEEA